MKNIALTLILLLLSLPGLAQRVSSPQEISVAGFFPLEGSGRQVYNFNPGWRFYRGDVKGAEAADFNDRDWEVVSTPHSVQLMPAEASGCRNYQGIAWYRKHFTVPASLKGMDVTIHFEAIMGKQKFYVNGQLVKEHLGGIYDFLRDRQIESMREIEQKAPVVTAEQKPKGPSGKAQYEQKREAEKQLRKAERDVEKAEQEIMALEKEIAEKDRQLAAPAAHGIDLADGSFYAHYNELKDKLNKLTYRWEELSITLENLKETLAS